MSPALTDEMVIGMDDTAGLHFDGATYDHERDCSRLAEQTRAVFDFMRDGQFRTLAAIAAHVGAPEASVSARLRDLRKPRFGGYTVKREHLSHGLHHYKLVVQETEH